MPKLTIAAPAKINLHLRVKEKRPDGFHELESVFAALAFGDTLHFELLPEDSALEIEMHGDFPQAAALPIEQNLIYKAVSRFRSHSGYTRGLRVRVEKRIPLGGGLGGGSSDAASTLLALNCLSANGAAGDAASGAASGGPLDAAALAEIAASLGSDVPFFLAETGAAWVRGRGERIRPLVSPKNLSVVLVNPGFESETAAAFRLLDALRASGSVKPAPCPPPDALIRLFAESPRNWPFVNDFLPVFTHNSAQNPGSVSAAAAYRDILAAFTELGADFAGLSGAGATCFGVFAEREQAEKTGQILSRTWNCVKVTFLLARRPIPVLE